MLEEVFATLPDDPVRVTYEVLVEAHAATITRVLRDALGVTDAVDVPPPDSVVQRDALSEAWALRLRAGR